MLMLQGVRAGGAVAVPQVGVAAGVPLLGALAGAVLKAGVHRAVVALADEPLPVGHLQVLASVPLVVLEAVVFVIPTRVVDLSSRRRVPREEALAAVVA